MTSEGGEDFWTPIGHNGTRQPRKLLKEASFLHHSWFYTFHFGARAWSNIPATFSTITRPSLFLMCPLTWHMAIMVSKRDSTTWQTDLAFIGSFHSKTCTHHWTGTYFSVTFHRTLYGHYISKVGANLKYGHLLAVHVVITIRRKNTISVHFIHSASFTCTWVHTYISERQMKKRANSWQ